MQKYFLLQLNFDTIASLDISAPPAWIIIEIPSRHFPAIEYGSMD